ncbi:F-box protein, partial [Xanthomonas perforans]|nr:F-box protein [Xanthomonas perforans]
MPDAQPSQNNPAAVFDGLSAMPPELRQQVVSRLSTRSMARLGATSRQMAADVREGMQTFLTEHPHYDPVADVGYVDSAARLRVALRMIRNLPYRDGEGRGPRLRAYAMYVERLRTLAQSERMEAAVILAEHVGHLPDPVALP